LIQPIQSTMQTSTISTTETPRQARVSLAPRFSAAQLSRGIAIVGLFFSSLLLVEHLSPGRGMCGYESDCDKVIFSTFGRLVGVPLPWIGVFAFAIFFALILALQPRLARMVRPMALTAGLLGALLIGIQVLVIRRVCPLCMIVDLCAVALGGVEIAWNRGRPVQAVGVRQRWIWTGAALIAVILPHLQPEREVPAEIKRLWVPGKVNIVELADFQCPHCRHMHVVLKQFLREQGDRVHYVELPVPMPKHSNSRVAARAYRCAQAQQKGAAMSDALFSADDLSLSGCRRCAQQIGLSLATFDACMANSNRDGESDEQIEWVKRVSPNGLPVIWVQDQMLPGMQSARALQVAVERAERRSERTTR
jgi:uncharacterized membrane protein